MIKKISKIFALILSITICIWVSTAAYDFVITDISLTNWRWTQISKWWNPDVDVTVKNIWNSIASNNWTVQKWFIRCREQKTSRVVWETNALSELIINSETEMKFPITLSRLLTATERTVNVTCQVNANNAFTAESNYSDNTKAFSLNIASGGNYDLAISESISSIRNHLNNAEPNSPEWGWVTIKNFIFNMISNFLVPIIILAGVIMWIIWGYQVITSDKPDKIKQWILNIVYGIVWIIIMLSAKYIWGVIFSIFQSWNLWDFDSITITRRLYEEIAYPFIKMAIYLSLWILFLILAWKTISIVTSGDVKKAGTIIAWTAISILVIIWAKQLVEAIYGKQEQVLNQSLNTLWDIGTWILADKNIPLIYDVINWVLWITALVILILIIVHTFKILTNPSKSDNWQSLWKSLLYIFIWILVIWTWYIITNLLVIN